MSERLYTTKRGHVRLLERMRRARASYDAVCATNGDAAEAGDNSVWHDNFAYEENQRQMHQLARRLRELEVAAARLIIVSPPRDPSVVSLGCAVRVRDVDANTERVWIIAGWEDGDTAESRISYTSPLAQALLGAEEGDRRSLELATGRVRLEVLEVSPAPEEAV